MEHPDISSLLSELPSGSLVILVGAREKEEEEEKGKDVIEDMREGSMMGHPGGGDPYEFLSLDLSGGC